MVSRVSTSHPTPWEPDLELRIIAEERLLCGPRQGAHPGERTALLGLATDQGFIGDGGEVLDDARIELPEQRQELAAHTDADESWIGVGGIDRERDLVSREVEGHVRARRA